MALGPVLSRGVAMAAPPKERLHHLRHLGQNAHQQRFLSTRHSERSLQLQPGPFCEVKIGMSIGPRTVQTSRLGRFCSGSAIKLPKPPFGIVS